MHTQNNNDLRVHDDGGKGEHDEVADGRVSAEKILKFVDGVLPGELRVALQLQQKRVCEVAAPRALLQTLAVLLDHSTQNELADRVRPVLQLFHVTLAKKQIIHTNRYNFFRTDLLELLSCIFQDLYLECYENKVRKIIS